ncbi:MAG: cyclic nucleotide-binding domain-containing protein [Magnetovibrionaceae bacterium]
MTRKTYSDGETLFREGEASESVFTLLSGTVELTLGSQDGLLELARLEPGELFGEMGILDGSPRSATATALGEIEVEETPPDVFLDRLQLEPDLALKIIGRLVQRLRETDARLTHLDGSADQLPARATAQARDQVRSLRRNPEQADQPGFFGKLAATVTAGLGDSARVKVLLSPIEGGDKAIERDLLALLDQNPRFSPTTFRHPVEAVDRQDPVMLAALAGSVRDALHSKAADLLVWGRVAEDGRSLHLNVLSAGPKSENQPQERLILEDPGLGDVGPTLVLALPFSERAADQVALFGLSQLLTGAGSEALADRDAVGTALCRHLENLNGTEGAIDDGLRAEDAAESRLMVARAVLLAAEAIQAAELTQAGVRMIREALDAINAEAGPYSWVRGHVLLAAGLGCMAELTKDPDAQVASSNVLKQTLARLDRVNTPDAWALVQQRLGLALYKANLKSGDAGLLKDAIVAFQAALKVRTRERDPLIWAEIMNQLAQAALILGRQVRKPDLLDKALDACEQSLLVRSRKSHPGLWAATQNNLGSAHFLLGRIERRQESFKLAEGCFGNAARVYEDLGETKQAAIAAKNEAHAAEARASAA